MKILFISEYFSPMVMGGGELNLVENCKKLIKEGHKVSVLTSHFPGLKSYERLHGISVHRLLSNGKNPGSLISNIKRFLIFPISVLNNVPKFEYDKLHFIGRSVLLSYYFKGNECTIENLMTTCPKSDRLYKNKKECPYVCNFPLFLKCQTKSNYIGKMKNWWFLKYNPLFLSLIWLNFKQLSGALRHCNIFTISRYMQRLLKLYGYESKIKPNIINKDLFFDKGSNKINNKPLFVCLGSLIEYRGFHLLLLASKGLNCKIKIYGSGVMQKELQKMIRKYNLDAQILPPVDYKKVPMVYSEADFIIVPSILPEPEGRVAKEALLMNKRVIVSKVGALKDLKNVKFFLPNNVNSLRNLLKVEIKQFKTKDF